METRFGWTGRIAAIDLTSGSIDEIATRDYADRFVGGRGIGLKLYWDMLREGRSAFDPASPLIIMTGPLAATAAPSGSRWVMCGKSPSLFPEVFASANLGGYVGGHLKKAGYDGLVITGKADGKVYLSITDSEITLRDASHLWGMTTDTAMAAIRRELGRQVKILTTGPAGENLVRLATVATDAGGSGSMGFGAVMGSKNLKAIAVHGTGSVPAARPEELRSIRKRIRSMTGEGYLNLYGMAPPLAGTEIVKNVHCHGCPQGCWRSLYRGESGTEGVRKCQAMFCYAIWDRETHGDLTEVSFLATEIANKYSLCTMELPGLLIWLQTCLREGILSEKDTGLAMDTIGSLAFIEDAAEKIAGREGFGDVLAEGVMRAARRLGDRALAAVLDHFTQTGRGIAYGPKVFSPAALIYATEPRAATTELHELCGPATKWAFWHTTGGAYSYVSTEVYRKIAERFWGGSDAADFSTYNGKGRAAALIQNRQYAKECLVLCDFAFPVYDDASSEDHVGDPALESRLLSAVTGIDIPEQELLRAGERSFNLYRAILLREGRRARADDYVPDTQYIEREEQAFDVFGMFNPELLLPGSGDAIVSRKGKALTREGFERMLDEYYAVRGWDTGSGLQKKQTLQRLGLDEVIDALGDNVR